MPIKHGKSAPIADVLAGFTGDMAARLMVWSWLWQIKEKFYKCGSGCDVHTEDIEEYACNFRNILNCRILGRSLAKLSAREKHAELCACHIARPGQDKSTSRWAAGRVESPGIVISSAVNVTVGEVCAQETAGDAMPAFGWSQRALGSRCDRVKHIVSRTRPESGMMTF